MAEEKSDESTSWMKIIPVVSAAVSLVVFLGWGDQLRQLIPFAHNPTPSAAATTPSLLPTTYSPIRVTPVPEAVRTTTTTYSPTTTTVDLETVRWNYINSADRACGAAMANRPGAISVATYGWMMQVLAAREQMQSAWQQVSIRPGDAVTVGRVQKMWADFTNANWYWKYMADSMQARNFAAYNANLNSFNLATSSFVDGANRFGFKVCNFQWNTMNPYG